MSEELTIPAARSLKQPLDELLGSFRPDSGSPCTELAQKAAFLARRLQEVAATLQTPEEERQQAELERMVQSPHDKATLTQLTDQAFRSRNPHRAVDQILHILDIQGIPRFFSGLDRTLLKVEQLHALARAVYYGQRGRISAREVYDQVNACSCLTLILACIVYWQAREISRLAAAPDFPFDPDLLRHVSPIEWKNVVLYGEIKIDPAKLTRRDR